MNWELIVQGLASLAVIMFLDWWWDKGSAAPPASTIQITAVFPYPYKQC